MPKHATPPKEVPKIINTLHTYTGTMSEVEQLGSDTMLGRVFLSLSEMRESNKSLTKLKLRYVGVVGLIFCDWCYSAY